MADQLSFQDQVIPTEWYFLFDGLRKSIESSESP